jgi:hypothetical protein
MRSDDWQITGVTGHTLTLIARALAWMAGVLTTWGEHCRRCPDCGRSVYHGRPCA